MMYEWLSEPLVCMEMWHKWRLARFFLFFSVVCSSGFLISVGFFACFPCCYCYSFGVA
jgi:hypothetical protein